MPSRICENIAGFLITFIPQIIIWKIQSGHFLHYSYTGESFSYIYNPKIMDVLFSDAKGLFIFSPILLISLIVLIMFWRETKLYRLSFCMVFILSTYICASWWCWWFGAAYGQRTFVDIMCIFAPPLCLLFKKMLISQQEDTNIVITLCQIIIWIIIIVSVLLNLMWISGVRQGYISANLSSWYELSSWLFKNN